MPLVNAYLADIRLLVFFKLLFGNARQEHEPKGFVGMQWRCANDHNIGQTVSTGSF